VTIELAHVNAATADTIWIAYHPGDPGYMGADFSAIEVDITGLPGTYQVGDLVKVVGTAGEIVDASSVALLGSGASPAPIAKTAADLAGNPPALDGLLIRLDSVTLIDGTVPWQITGPSAVTGRIYAGLPTKPDGTGITSITGIADTRGAEPILLPRAAADIVFAPT
jgi:hypothetical protein